MGAEEHVLLCFYLQKAFLDDTTSLPQMTYSAILNDSVKIDFVFSRVRKLKRDVQSYQNQDLKYG